VRDEVRAVLAESPGGHGPELTELLSTLQGLAREHPAATW
jgi:hypothetical protein